MANFGYYLLKALTWWIHLFPLRINYILSDFLYILIYHIVGYRKRVVFANLTNSFPEKGPEEIKKIAKKFYQYLADSFIETLYYDRISEEEIRKRLVFKNIELPNKYLSEGRMVAALMGHYANFEWLTSWPLHSSHEFCVIYKKLRNPSFDRFYIQQRSRFGTRPLEKAVSIRALLNNMKIGKGTLIAFLFDQSPKKHEIEYWSTFLNQETALITGTEKVCKKLGAVSIFEEIKRVKRGYYEVTFHLIDEDASKTSQFELSEKMNRKLEEIIREEPAYWLWSHKRWKHKREA